MTNKENVKKSYEDTMKFLLTVNYNKEDVDYIVDKLYNVLYKMAEIYDNADEDLKIVR